MSAIVVVDALWGDSGKGKTCAHLAGRRNVTLNVRAGAGTNAGTSVTLEDGTPVKARQLPIGWTNPRTRVAVGSGTMVDPAIFLSEVERFGLAGRAFVDGRCGVIDPQHVAAEKADAHLAATVGSTCSGSGSARADFVLRRARQVRDVPELEPYVLDVAREANRVAAAPDETVLIAGSQGTMLSLALSPDYPYTTSANCTAVAAMSDVGLNWRLVTDVVMIVKAMPSRVGQGPLPFELSAADTIARGIAEYGVNTGRLRRKAERPDFDLLAYAAMLNGATQIALSFCDHYDPQMRGGRSADRVTPRVRELIGQVEEATGAPVTMLDTGPRLGDMIDL